MWVGEVESKEDGGWYVFWGSFEGWNWGGETSWGDSMFLTWISSLFNTIFEPNTVFESTVGYKAWSCLYTTLSNKRYEDGDRELLWKETFFTLCFNACIYTIFLLSFLNLIFFGSIVSVGAWETANNSGQHFQFLCHSGYLGLINVNARIVLNFY